MASRLARLAASRALFRALATRGVTLHALLTTCKSKSRLLFASAAGGLGLAAVAPIMQLSSRMDELDLNPSITDGDENAGEEMVPADEQPQGRRSDSFANGYGELPSALEMKTVDAGAASIPHPDKAHKGGEDAFHISANHRVLAVADGVGGWAELNVDPALFSKGLCAAVGEHALRALDSDDLEMVRDVLQRAYDEICDQGIEGSTTLCSTYVYSDHIITCNLGDSGLRVIRNNEVVYRTREQTHQFNFPYQLGSCGRGEAEHPQDAAIERFDVEEGDVLVLGSDGMIDNIFDAQLVKLVRDNIDLSAQEIASIIATAASAIAADSSADTPFARDAADHGLSWFGGKLDDITIVVAKL